MWRSDSKAHTVAVTFTIPGQKPPTPLAELPKGTTSGHCSYPGVLKNIKPKHTTY